MSERIRLNGVEVVFANLDDTGYGKSITIAATDPEVQKEITEWVKENNIGKGDKAGVPNFKDYEGKKQYAFKINDYTRFAGLNGLTQNNLGFGARVSLIASAFEWSNKFGSGISSSLTAVLVEKAANSASDGDLAELLGDNPNATVEGLTIVEDTASGYDKAKAQAEAIRNKKSAPVDEFGNTDIDMDSIPF
jgi:TusA-related sulfurtransferase